MLILSSTNDQIQLVTDANGNVTTHATWVDTIGGAVTPGRTNTAITTAATTNISGSPVASNQRNVKTLHISNNPAGGVATNVIVQHTDGTTVAQLYKCQLVPGDILQYTDQAGFGSATAFSTSIGWATGDVKLTYKNAPDPGWIIANDGSIGNAASNATTRKNADTRALFIMLWNLVVPLEVQDSVGNVVARGGSAAADFDSNRRLVIPRMLGRALAAAGTGAGLTQRDLGTSFGTEGATQTVATMAPHNHTGGQGEPWFAIPYGPAPALFGQFMPDTLINMYYDIMGYTGGGAPMTNIQPTSYLNVWIKL